MRNTTKPPFNKISVFFISATTLAVLTVFPWYAVKYGFTRGDFIGLAAFMVATGLSITAGYHRLWAHRSYEAGFAMRVFYMLFGGMAVQNSILIWTSTHRRHHAHVDDYDRDPYAVTRGFWHAHIGWILRDYPSGTHDFSNVPDLQRDPVVMFQHRHYLLVAAGTNIGLTLAIGALIGDPIGFFLMVGLLRLVVNQHFTFFINSLAHIWGRRPYTAANSARDNDLLAVLTYGEGYHNYHHEFQWDYRNGVNWWHLDASKWWIAGWARLGLTRGLRRVPRFKIQQALLKRQFEKIEERLTRTSAAPGRLEALQHKLQTEAELFVATLNRWTELQSQRIANAKQQWAEFEARAARDLERMLEGMLVAQRKRLRALPI